MRLGKSIWIILTLVLTLGCCSPVWASGGSTHMLASELALEQVQDPALLRLLKIHHDTVIWASWYPDGGYVVDGETGSDPDDYGERSHWGAFQETYWHLVATEKRYPSVLAHFLGATAHGLGDEIFDSIFFPQGRQQGENIDQYDTGIDLLLIREQNRFGAIERGLLPVATLMEVYNRMGLDGEAIAKKTLLANQILWAGVKGEQVLSLATYQKVKAAIPWASLNYMNAPGGVRFMASWIARFWEERGNLFQHQDPTPTWPVIARYPEKNADLSSENTPFGSRPPLFIFFGVGMNCRSIINSIPWTAVDPLTRQGISLRPSRVYPEDACHLIRLDPEVDWPKDPFDILIGASLSTWDDQTRFTLTVLPEF